MKQFFILFIFVYFIFCSHEKLGNRNKPCVNDMLDMPCEEMDSLWHHFSLSDLFSWTLSGHDK